MYAEAGCCAKLSVALHCDSSISYGTVILNLQGDVWIDGVYIRQITEGKIKALGGTTTIQKNMWMTNCTFQSSGKGAVPCEDCENWPDAGILVLGQLYAQGTVSVSTLNILYYHRLVTIERVSCLEFASIVCKLERAPWDKHNPIKFGCDLYVMNMCLIRRVLFQGYMLRR